MSYPMGQEVRPTGHTARLPGQITRPVSGPVGSSAQPGCPAIPSNASSTASGRARTR